MSDKSHSLRNGIIYIVLAGAILFAAVALGIQVGFALRSDDEPGELNPETLPNRSSLKPGDAIPSLPVYDLDKNEFTLTNIVAGKNTLVGVVMPGCEPCKKLLSGWIDKEIVGAKQPFQIILLATSAAEERELGPLEEFSKDYPVYFCDHVILKNLCGLTTFPSIVGLGADNKVSFVANEYVFQLDVEFFNKYL